MDKELAHTVFYLFSNELTHVSQIEKLFIL